MTQQFDFGMIGLGVMGSNLLLNMADHHFAAIGFDLKPERTQALEEAATKGTIVKGVNSLEHLVTALKKPRKIMMLVPAGKPVDDVMESLLPLLDKGDIVIDGGNSFYKDTLRRVTFLQHQGIHFMGMGISGGEMGARIGPSIMPGGDAEAYEYLKPILESIAAKAKGKPCVAYMGKGAAGHYVKMVHNGIEYALMQMISEVYDFLKRGMGFSNEELHQVFAQWNKGPLQSFLIDITSEIFNVADTETGEQLIDKILDKGGAKGTGKWTSQEAMDHSVPLSVTDAAVAMRNLSVYKDQRVQASKLYTHKRVVSNTEKSELTVTAEKALYAGFIISYAQGFHLLSKASDDLAMNIPLKDVVQVWKSGCIIRAEMLQLFTAAWERDPSLQHLLLDEKMAVVVQENIPSLRQLIMEGVQNRIPMSALSNALSYFDAFTSDRLPMNLVQAQRDYFGAHTYQRIDKEGVFHTVWNADLE